MHYLTLFGLTFLAAALATLPPGLLNMNAAKIAVDRGKRDALLFAFACSLVVLLESLGASLFSKYLYQHPDSFNQLLWISLFIFVGLAIYFWRKSNRPYTIQKSTSRPFRKGLSLAFLNVLMIPFYAGLHSALRTSKVVRLVPSETLVFAAAAMSGTFVILYGYAYGFAQISFDEIRFEKRSNRLIALLMLLLALGSFIRLILSYVNQ